MPYKIVQLIGSKASSKLRICEKDDDKDDSSLFMYKSL